MKILLISSTGGHFQAIQKLSYFWRKHDCCWVTFRTDSTELILKDKKVYWAYSPTNRNVPNLIRNFILAWQVIWQERPQLVLTTGAGVSVPFIILAKLAGTKTVFVESFTRVKELSLSARLVLPFLDVVYVQWEQLTTKYSKAKLIRI
ncbi:PssD/Cps14F family polysaccharide biosynthesis glycosyltransferase [Myxosarcina sp. GI1]|uniref:PssD/Cps14F family polysaccharide biosynthesis glycosyltransferase n=1 Tax=Myxosarcina sp. GI1 TaxID=1541065 RepID=UPI00056797A4|nr:PssD/Cps14F family polysaccharide biosynthesis glycosyltransferase [Myxosarcina sp. GI1]